MHNPVSSLSHPSYPIPTKQQQRKNALQVSIKLHPQTENKGKKKFASHPSIISRLLSNNRPIPRQLIAPLLVALLLIRPLPILPLIRRQLSLLPLDRQLHQSRRLNLVHRLVVARPENPATDSARFEFLRARRVAVVAVFGVYGRGEAVVFGLVGIGGGGGVAAAAAEEEPEEAAD